MQYKYFLFTHVEFDIKYNADRVIEINLLTDPQKVGRCRQRRSGGPPSRLPPLPRPQPLSAPRSAASAIKRDCLPRAALRTPAAAAASTQARAYLTPPPPSCNTPLPPSHPPPRWHAQAVDIIEGVSTPTVKFTYSVKWSLTSMKYEDRLQRYERFPLNPVHLEVGDSPAGPAGSDIR